LQQSRESGEKRKKKKKTHNLLLGRMGAGAQSKTHKGKGIGGREKKAAKKGEACAAGERGAALFA